MLHSWDETLTASIDSQIVQHPRATLGRLGESHLVVVDGEQKRSGRGHHVRRDKLNCKAHAASGLPDTFADNAAIVRNDRTFIPQIYTHCSFISSHASLDSRLVTRAEGISSSLLLRVEAAPQVLRVVVERDAVRLEHGEHEREAAERHDEVGERRVAAAERLPRRDVVLAGVLQQRVSLERERPTSSFSWYSRSFGSYRPWSPMTNLPTCVPLGSLSMSTPPICK